MSNQTTNHFLYVRAASKYKDGNCGVLYRHYWATGWQELVVPSHELAMRWIMSQTQRQSA